MQRRRNRLLPLVVLFAACGREPAGDAASDARGPELSLLVVSLDTTRADHLSAFGYERPTSPSLAALADEGHRFDDAWTVIGVTLPAHAALLTSLYPSELGVPNNGFPVPSDARTLAERLGERDVATAAFVSGITLDRRFGLDEGFDVYEGPAEGKRDATSTVELALAWLKAQRGRRWFALVHLFDAHTWYEPPPSTAELFGAPAGPHPPARGFLEADRRFDAATRSAAVAAYDGEIRHADDELGRLLGVLGASGELERTIVVVLADHGEILDERLESEGYAFDHGEFLYRAELRVPLVLWLPASHPLRGPAAHAETVSLVDVAPTVLELLGVPPEPPLSGRSLAPLLAGERFDPRPAVSERREASGKERARLGAPRFSVVAGRWHWIGSPDPEVGPGELYDLANDPEELLDLAREEPARVADARAALEAWRERHGTPLWPRGRRASDADTRRALEALGYGGGDE